MSKMSEKKDDPREVLSLLNSLGFVGITAQQLKAFMKDLKIHRKIKERERQQWKEDTRKKILLQQQQLYREVLREHKTETGFTSVTESTISSESSTYKDDSSCKLVTVKIRCFPKEEKEEENDDDAEKENNNNNNHLPRQRKKTSFTKKSHTSWAEELRQNSLRYDDTSYNATPSSSSADESQRRYEQSNNHSVGASTDSTKYISLEKPRGKTDQRLKQSNLAPPKSPPRRKSSSTSRCTVENRRENTKEQRVVEAPSNPPPSRSSAASSRPKSFIRPWRLQPESHRSCTNTKSDPVALYQKYRDQWKQLALPGEENHAGVRWAVREKMLGNDPNPRQGDDFVTHRDISKERYYIDDFREDYLYRRKSRKVEKLERKKKPVFFNVSERRDDFCNDIRQSFYLRSTNFRLLSENQDETAKSQSILRISTNFDKYKQRDLDIRENCETVASDYKYDKRFGKIRSEVGGAKKTLGRLVDKILGKDINCYVENYKYLNKCRCSF